MPFCWPSCRNGCRDNGILRVWRFFLNVARGQVRRCNFQRPWYYFAHECIMGCSTDKSISNTRLIKLLANCDRDKSNEIFSYSMTLYILCSPLNWLQIYILYDSKHDSNLYATTFNFDEWVFLTITRYSRLFCAHMKGYKKELRITNFTKIISKTF